MKAPLHLFKINHWLIHYFVNYLQSNCSQTSWSSGKKHKAPQPPISAQCPSISNDQIPSIQTPEKSKSYLQNVKDKWLEKWKNDHYLRKQCYLWTGVSLLLLSITILFFILLKRFVIGSFQNLDSKYALKPSASTFLLRCDGIKVDVLGYSVLLSRFFVSIIGNNQSISKGSSRNCTLV